MNDTIEIVLPVPPNRANQSRGIARYEGFYKRRYFKQCAGALMEAKVMRGPVPWPFIYWQAHIEVGSAMDADNLAARCKWPLDALVWAGLIRGDDRTNAWPKGWPTQEVITKRKGKNRKFILQIEVVR